MRKILSVLLLISGLMPLFIGLTCLCAYDKALGMLKLTTNTPDVFLLTTIFGVCGVSLGVVQFVAAYWTLRKNWNGVVLARFVGLLICFSGIVMYATAHRPDLAIPDVVKGSLIGVIAFVIPKEK